MLSDAGKNHRRLEESQGGFAGGVGSSQPPDEAKVKGLVTAFAAAQLNLFNSFRGEIDW